MARQHEGLMAHERMRWGYMTDEQLARRLRAIKQPAKLWCFFRMCEERLREVVTMPEYRTCNFLVGAFIQRCFALGYNKMAGDGESLLSRIEQEEGMQVEDAEDVAKHQKYMTAHRTYMERQAAKATAAKVAKPKKKVASKPTPSIEELDRAIDF